ncbi:stalk domain-containing protein [Petroclostridium sp. X23]|uniref:stalk domain-containing protein n=1 Tax=Petroclostridium sp. X23 TaxID=3045146 RepID=UPI0024ADBE3C|nr:stalk domain-containing protein [Petroclostridium sp. X23]WHH61072.1 stalk domain-containing protein [Petroclostridium sp. X23]
MLKSKYTFVVVVLILGLITSAYPAFAGQIAVESFAGSGGRGYQDGSRLKANFSIPYGITPDKQGNLLAADSYNHCIRKIVGGQATTVAGFFDIKDAFGLPVGALVDGDALKARFNRPRDIAVDSKGDIYVADTLNHVIRKIFGGKVYTFAGTGESGYQDGKGDKAKFNHPSGLAIDGEDNLYVTDTLNHVIRMVTPKGEVTTFAGKHSTQGGYQDGDMKTALFNEPADLDMDKDGALYIVDSGNQLIRKAYEGKVTTFAGSRGALMEGTDYAQGGFSDGYAASFNFPKGIDVTEDGAILVADTWNHAVRRIEKDGKVVTVVGTGKPGNTNGVLSDAALNGPVDVLYYSGNLYISDMWNNSIKVMPYDIQQNTQSIDIEQMVQSINYQPVSDEIQIWVNGKQVEFPDVKPYIKDGKTFMPLRFIVEACGAQVKWHDTTQQVQLIEKDFSTFATLNDDTLKLENGRTMVHVRYLADSLGYKIKWVPEHSAVVISTK